MAVACAGLPVPQQSTLVQALQPKPPGQQPWICSRDYSSAAHQPIWKADLHVLPVPLDSNFTCHQGSNNRSTTTTGNPPVGISTVCRSDDLEGLELRVPKLSHLGLRGCYGIEHIRLMDDPAGTEPKALTVRTMQALRHQLHCQAA